MATQRLSDVLLGMIPKAASYSDYLTSSQETLDTPQYADLLGSIKSSRAALAGEQYAAGEAVATQQVPVVRQMYQSIADELIKQEDVQVGYATNVATYNTGAAKAQAAASGIDPSKATGAFAATIQAAQQAGQKGIADVQGQFELKLRANAATAASEISGLIDKAEQYRIAGKTTEADAAEKLATLADSHQKEITSMASQMYNAATKEEMDAWREFIQMRQSEQSDDRLAIAAQNAATAAASAATSAANSNLAEKRFEYTISKDQESAINKGITDAVSKGISYLHQSNDYPRAFNETKAQLPSEVMNSLSQAYQSSDAKKQGISEDDYIGKYIDTLLGVPEDYKGPGWQYYTENPVPANILKGASTQSAINAFLNR